jgi:hypothetical protein
VVISIKRSVIEPSELHDGFVLPIPLRLGQKRNRRGKRAPTLLLRTYTSPRTNPLLRRRGWGGDINEIEVGRGRVVSIILRSVVLAKA